MANVKPPAAYAGTPAQVSVAAGTVLYRVHLKKYDADEFNPHPSHRYYGGGRFDATDDDPYPFIYAGETLDNCIAETLLRDLPLDDTGARVLPRIATIHRRVSAITITTDLPLVALRSGTELAAVSQDPWLVWCEPRDYAQSRHWGHWIRQQVPHAAGYVWQSRREPLTNSFVLFGDRIPAGAVVSSPADPALPAGDRADFDTPRGRAELRRRLAQYNVTIVRR